MIARGKAKFLIWLTPVEWIGACLLESYPRFGLMRNFPGFKERNVFNPAFGKKQK